ncbi:MAG: phosphotransferase [Candidatus Hodarchaeota archaeon]
MELFKKVSVELCIKIIEKNFPEIHVTDIKFNDEGWDYQIFIINNEFIFRFPRHQDASQRLDLEIQLLNHLQKEIHTSIPNYEYKVKLKDSNSIFGGYKMIKGKNLTPLVLNQIHTEKLKKNLAIQIADFLSSLHRFPIQKAFELKFSREGKKEDIISFYQEVKQEVFPIITAHEQDWANNLFDAFLNEDSLFKYDPVLIHGDFSSDHILYDEKQEKIGVIDFSDVSVSDPARDFGCMLDFGKDFDQWVIKNYYNEIDFCFLKRRMFYFKLVPFYEMIGGINLHNPKFIKAGHNYLKELMSSKDEY